MKVEVSMDGTSVVVQTSAGEGPFQLVKALRAIADVIEAKINPNAGSDAAVAGSTAEHQGK